MNRFEDRKEAAHRLIERLQQEVTNIEEFTVIALPRGGVVIGYEIANHFHLPLDIVCPRKIPAPFNSEFAIGAITETGHGIFNDRLIAQLGITESFLQRMVDEEKKEALRRLNHYREGRPPRNLKEKHIILVDDGLATGSTMMAAIETVKAEGALEIIVAIPVAPPDSIHRIEPLVNRVICLQPEENFYAISQFYHHFDQTSDEEVISLLKKI